MRKWLLALFAVTTLLIIPVRAGNILSDDQPIVSTSGIQPPLGNMVGWWDTSVTASLNLTGPVVNNIADLSGRAQTMFGNLHNFGSPTYSATGFNTSKPGILITTAVGSSLETVVGFPMGTGNTLTWFFVGTNMGVTANSDARYLSYSDTTQIDDASDGTWTYTENSTTTTSTKFQRNPGSHTPTAVSITAGNHVVIGTVDATGAVLIYIDGVLNTAQTGNSGNWTTGGYFAVGNEAGRFNSGHYGTLTVAEWGVSTGLADAATIAALYASLKAKWGL